MSEQPQPQPQRPSSEQHASFQTGANISSLGSAANLRQRSLGRAAPFSEAGPSTTASPAAAKFRRNSALSDTVSEARQSIQNSTDYILFPRANTIPTEKGGIGGEYTVDSHHDSHWQSAPLALALLPAVGGLFFQNGSAFVTDATLLILAAIFLNWSVRLPWNWYRSAQEIRQPPPESILSENGTILEEEEENGEEEQEGEEGNGNDNSPSKKKQQGRKELETHSASRTAIKELHTHEIAALISCFVFPLIGAWLLHAVRGALSRPSEGLVSNYNLTIFILAAEIRPFAHLLRMVQGRTLYLQRVVAAAAAADEGADDRIDTSKILDLATRLEDLEAHIADKAAANPTATLSDGTSTEAIKPEIIAQITAEVRQSFQPEIDALNRAVRRYEKRTALMAFQIDSRMNQLETQVGDTLALFSAVQQQSAGANWRHQGLVGLVNGLISSLYALAVIPVRTMAHLVSLPGRVASLVLHNVVALLPTGKRGRRTTASKGKQAQSQSQFQVQGQPQITRSRSSNLERRHVATASTQGGTSTRSTKKRT